MARPRLALHTRMLLGLAAGATLGGLAHAAFGDAPALDTFVRWVTEPAGQLFLRLLFMLVVPLIVSALALGVCALGDLRSVGRIGLLTLVYTVTVSTIAVFIGVALVNLLQPGRGWSEETRAELVARTAERATSLAQTAPPKTGIDLLIQIVPSNPIRAAADGDMLAVMFVALLLGVALSVTRTEGARKLEEVLQGVYDVTMWLIGLVISLAPWGVAALLFTLTARLGYGVLAQLARYVAVVVLLIILLL